MRILKTNSVISILILSTICFVSCDTDEKQERDEIEGNLRTRASMSLSNEITNPHLYTIKNGNVIPGKNIEIGEQKLKFEIEIGKNDFMFFSNGTPLKVTRETDPLYSGTQEVFYAREIFNISTGNNILSMQSKRAVSKMQIRIQGADAYSSASVEVKNLPSSFLANGSVSGQKNLTYNHSLVNGASSFISYNFIAPVSATMRRVAFVVNFSGANGNYTKTIEKDIYFECNKIYQYTVVLKPQLELILNVAPWIDEGSDHIPNIP